MEDKERKKESQRKKERMVSCWLTRTTQQAKHAPSPREWGMRVGAAYTQTGVLAKGGVKGSAGEIEELGRELGLGWVCLSTKNLPSFITPSSSHLVKRIHGIGCTGRPFFWDTNCNLSSCRCLL